MAVVWEFMLHPSFGIVKATMEMLGLPPRHWLKESGIALYVLAVIGIWQSFGFNMVLFMAGLSAIPAPCTKRRKWTEHPTPGPVSGS